MKTLDLKYIQFLQKIVSKAGIICSVCFVLLCSVPALAQVGIGTNTPDPSAQLDVSSSSKGLLLPRMSRNDRDLISDPATGLMIFQNDETPGFYYYSGSALGWLPLISEPSPAIIPFSSGEPIILTSVIGGLVQTGASIGFGASASGVTLTGPTIDLNSGLGISNFAFSAPRTGTITSLSAFFSNNVASVLIGTTLTIRAQLYRSTTPDNFFIAIPDAIVNLGPSLTGFSPPNNVCNGIVSDLNIPVNAQDRLLLVFSVISSDGSSAASIITGYASAGLSIK